MAIAQPGAQLNDLQVERAAGKIPVCNSNGCIGRREEKMGYLGRGTVLLLVLQMCASSPASSQPLPGLNFKGKTICLSTGKPAIIGIPYSSVPSPILRMETAIGSKSANYTITFGDFGTFSLSEEISNGNECSALSLDRFEWRDDPDGRHSKANFCVTNFDPDPKIHIQASVNATRDADELKGVVVALAACRMSTHPGLYIGGDSVELRPELVAHDPP